MKYILVFISVLNTSIVFTQTNTIDSLKKALQTQKEDTSKVKTFNALSEEFRFKDKDQQFKYGSDALQLAGKINYKEGEAYAYSNLARFYNDQANFPMEVENIYAAYKLFEETGNKKMVAYSRHSIAGIYVQNENYAMARKWYQLSLAAYQELGDQEGIARIHNGTGTIDERENNFSAALQKYSAAIKIYSDLGSSAPAWSLPYCNNNLAVVYERLADASGDTGDKIGKYNQALMYYKRAFHAADSVHRYDMAGETCLLLGNIYFKLGKFSEARSHLEKGFTLLAVYRTNNNLLNYYYTLSKIDSAEKNYEQAYKNYQLYNSYSDSISKEARSKKIVEVQMQYDFDKRQAIAKAGQNKKDALAIAELENQKLIRNFSLTGVFLVVSFGGYSFYRYRRRRKLQSEQEMLNERLRISRELHDDMGSTLGSISIYTEVAKNRSAKNENADEVILKIGAASRELIDKMSDIVWSINPNNESIEQLKNRMQAFAAMILTPHYIEYNFLANDAIKMVKLTAEERKNIFLIFKEVIHNIVKYAECQKVEIKLLTQNNEFEMQVKDDGKGFDVTKLTSTHSLGGNGIKNMKARSESMNADLKIDSEINKGTVIVLKVNLK
jgi:signal transduction histidine kinase